MKKLIILITVIISFFIFFLYMYFSPRDYEKTYKVNKVNITETYNEKNDYYYLNFKYKNKVFEYASNDSYTNKRGLIKNVKIINEDEILCLIPESEYLKTYPICYKNKKLIDYHLSGVDFNDYDKKLKTKEESYKDINIHCLNNKTILVWNYKGFNYLKKDDFKQIKFLENDIYNLDLVAKVNNYLLVPDYDNKHTFNKIFIIDLKDGNIKTWDLKYEIYFDSYIVGIDSKSVFLFDQKNEIEYELRPDKMKMRKVNYKVKNKGEWQKISLGELKKEKTFSEENVNNYKVINNKLYLYYNFSDTKELISNKEVKDIIYIEDKTVYYLVEDKLYMYNKEYGEVLLLDYFEWNFNYKNMIYIY